MWLFLLLFVCLHILTVYICLPATSCTCAYLCANACFCPSVSFPSHSFWPNAPGGEGETAGRVLVWHGAHAPRGSRSEGSGTASVRGLSEILPPHQGQGQGHPLWQDRRQCGKQDCLAFFNMTYFYLFVYWREYLASIGKHLLFIFLLDIWIRHICHMNRVPL